MMVRPRIRRYPGPFGAVQVFDVQVGASLDDGHNWGGTLYRVSITASPGNTSTNVTDSFHRYTNVTIPGGATITKAYITVEAHSGTDAGVLSNIYANDHDDAVAPTDNAEMVALARTTAFTAWDGEVFSADTPTNSDDIAAVIQEIIDRGGWNSGQALMIIWDDDGSPNDKRYRIHSYDGQPIQTQKLHVEYTT